MLRGVLCIPQCHSATGRRSCLVVLSTHQTTPSCSSPLQMSLSLSIPGTDNFHPRHPFHSLILLGSLFKFSKPLPNLNRSNQCRWILAGVKEEKELKGHSMLFRHCPRTFRPSPAAWGWPCAALLTTHQPLDQDLHVTKERKGHFQVLAMWAFRRMKLTLRHLKWVTVTVRFRLDERTTF